MPLTDGLEMLVRTTPLSEADWLSLAERRSGMIKPHLDSFTLDELRKVPCLKNTDGPSKGFHLDSPTMTGGEGALQGIFGYHYASRLYPGRKPEYDQLPPDGSLVIWGFSRAGTWVLARVSFTGDRGYKERFLERATSVVISETDLINLCREAYVSPKEVYQVLGVAVERFAEKREGLYRVAQNLQSAVRAENTMIGLIDPEET